MFMRRVASLFFLLSLTIFHSPPRAQANIGEAYGFSSRSASLSGAGAAWGFDGFASYTNPAGLPAVSERAPDGTRRIAVSYSLLYMAPSFLPIDGVVVENNYTSAVNEPRSGSVDTEYRPTLGQALGVSLRLGPDSPLVLGVTAYLPLQQIAYLDTGEILHPEYVLYRARTQRPQFALALGTSLSPAFSIGAGILAGYSLTSSATLYLQTVSDKPSNMRFSASLKPKAAPYLGVLYASPSKEFSLGTVFRLPISPDNLMTVKTGANLGGFHPFDINLTGLSALYYDPMTLEIGASWQHSSQARFYAQADYQFWSRFRAPALDIQGCDPSSQPTTCGITISNGSSPAYSYRNILVARFGEEIRWGGLTYRLGYGYRPSFLRDLPNDAGNYLDPPRHMVNGGIGLTFERFIGFETPLQLDLHLSWHPLVKQRIQKNPGDEAGNGSGDAKIGAPGYDAGGKILGGGVSLNWVF